MRAIHTAVVRPRHILAPFALAPILATPRLSVPISCAVSLGSPAPMAFGGAGSLRWHYPGQVRWVYSQPRRAPQPVEPSYWPIAQACQPTPIACSDCASSLVFAAPPGFRTLSGALFTESNHMLIFRPKCRNSLQSGLKHCRDVIT